MSQRRIYNKTPVAKSKSVSELPRNYGTQTETKITKNVGTMSKIIEKRNFGTHKREDQLPTQTASREISPQIQSLRPASSTSSLQHQPKKPTDRKEDYVTSPKPSLQQNGHSEYGESQSSFRPYNKNDLYHKDPTAVDDDQQSNNHPTHSSLSNEKRTSPPRSNQRASSTQRSRSPSETGHHSSSTDRYRTASTQTTQTTQTTQDYRETERSRSPSPTRHRTTSTRSKKDNRPTERSRSPIPNGQHGSSSVYRTPSPSREKDSSKPKGHPEPRSRTNSITETQPQTKHSADLDTVPSTSHYQKLTPSSQRPNDSLVSPSHRRENTSSVVDPSPSTQKNYLLRPNRKDSYVDNYGEISTKYNKSIPAEHNHSFDHSIHSIPQWHVFDRHIQTKLPGEEPLNKEVHHTYPIVRNDFVDEPSIQDLPRVDSASISPSPVIQPDTLRRSFTHHTPLSHGADQNIDNKRRTAEPPFRYGQQHQTPPMSNSPVLNIGTENIIRHSPNNEFTTPYEPYTYEPNRDYTTNNNNIRSSTLKREDLRSRNNRVLVLPVLNSSRTYVFEKQPLTGAYSRQSRNDGNIHLAAPPTTRSINSSLRAAEPENDSNYSTGPGLRSQFA